MVAGSNPARGANQIKHLAQKRKILENPRVGAVLANRLPRFPAVLGVKTRGFAGTGFGLDRALMVPTQTAHMAG
jgi:hypothetical protein